MGTGTEIGERKQLVKMEEDFKNLDMLNSGRALLVLDGLVNI